MHEIITLQLGQRSNYLATHFWNTQESYFTYAGQEESPIDHDVHFRPGTGADGSETFTPRTLIYDLKGGFGSLRQYNALYEAQNDPGFPRGLWDGNVVVQQQPAIGHNDYQRSLQEGLPAPPLSTETVRYWSDFNRVYYHPRSIVQLNDYELNSRLMPFESYDVGDDLFNNIDREHDILDRDVRLFAEECDQLSGFQIFSGTDDAWGGFAARYVDRLNDEFGKNSIWVWGLEDGMKGQRQQQMTRFANMARSTNEISTSCTAYVPVSDPPSLLPSYVQLQRQSQWMSAALLSTAIESVTLPSRFRSIDGRHGSLGNLEALLNTNGNQRILKLQSTILQQVGMNGHAHETQSSGHRDGDQNDQIEDGTEDISVASIFDMDFTPADPGFVDSRRKHYFGQVEVVRDTIHDGEKSSRKDEDDKWRGRLEDEPNYEKYTTGLLYPIIDSFPRTMIRSAGSSQSPKLAIRTALSTTSEVAARIKAIRRVVTRSIRIEERENLTNGLGEICDAYEEGYDSGSDGDMDED